MKVSKKVQIAQSLVNILLENNDGWENWRKSPYKGSIFTTVNLGESLSDNAFIQITSKNKILCIGKYESRYYTDEEEYYSTYYYFFSFGNIEGQSITSLETVTEEEYGGSVKLGELYSKANLSYMDIDIDDIQSSFF